MDAERLAAFIKKQLVEIADLSGVDDSPETTRYIEGYERLSDKLQNIITWIEGLIYERGKND